MSQKFFEIIPSGTKIDFLKNSKWFVAFSVLFLVVGVGSLATKGLNYGVDFKGGTQVHLKFKGDVSSSDIRKALEKVNLDEAMVQGYGEEGQNEYLVRVLPKDLSLENSNQELETILNELTADKSKPVRLRFSEERVYVLYSSSVDPMKIKEALSRLKRSDLIVESVVPFGQPDNHEYLVRFAGAATKINQALNGVFGSDAFETLQIEQVGAKVGGKLRTQAVGAVAISIILILIYVWVRFDLEFAPGAIAALVHDALIVLSIFSLANLQFDLSIVAAVLTIVGYSINDTIVIYDRIRENKGKARSFNLVELINNSLNETLGRTILTSATLFFAAMALLLVGGPITSNFALAFVVGVISGTYSTIFIASPLTVYFYNYLQKRKIKAV